MSCPEEASNGFRTGTELLLVTWRHAEDGSQSKCLLFGTVNAISGMDGGQLLTQPIPGGNDGEVFWTQGDVFGFWLYLLMVRVTWDHNQCFRDLGYEKGPWE